MLKNYLRISLNNLLKHKLYSAINVFGLAVRLACCLLIGIFVRHELSYDTFFPGAERIYRLSPDFAASSLGPERHPAGNVAPLAPLIRGSAIPGVEKVARIGGMHVLVAREDRVFYEENFRWADSEIFDVFEFDWLRGERAGALAEPASVAISASMARKYFGDANPMGQTLMLDNNWLLTVGGVFRDVPENSHLSETGTVSQIRIGRNNHV